MRKIINWRDMLRSKMATDTMGNDTLKEEERHELRDDLEEASEKFNVIATNCM